MLNYHTEYILNLFGESPNLSLFSTVEYSSSTIKSSFTLLLHCIVLLQYKASFP